MLIKKRKTWDVPETEVTDETAYVSRRDIMRAAGLGAAISGTVGYSCLNGLGHAQADDEARPGKSLDFVKGKYRVSEDQTDYEAVTGFNNFYELGTSKGAPSQNAEWLKTDPWSITVEGEVAKPGKIGFEDLIAPHQLEERIYRLRCVEAWSMVVPWIGIPLADVLKRFEPTSNAKYLRFYTLFDPENLKPQSARWPSIPFPYKEGIRIDEAMNPLAFLVTGLYGKELPNQNGAPIRLALPWKYGFKSIKSIVKIQLVKNKPTTTWNEQNPREYGFYANVNPEVSHPRWSQAMERRIVSAGRGGVKRIKTKMFNGYADEVAGMYSDMNLAKYY
ncbi:MAG: protein-methionine-sulfoxide reductase catalytic subunit MsrP [Pseudomonadota bacterium]